jgi:hypothetical protein
MSSSDNGKRGLETADDYFAVTPSDTVDLPVIPRALLISVGGTLHVQKPNGTEVSTTVPAGEFPGRVKRVYLTGTAATGITALV